MKNLLKLLSVSTVIAAAFIGLVLTVYLKVIPYAVSNQNVINYVNGFVKESTGADLKIVQPILETKLSGDILFAMEELSLTKDKKEILSMKKLDTQVSFEQILKHRIILKKLGLDYLFADINGLTALSGEPQQKEPQKSDWTVEWINSLLSLKKCKIVYSLDKDTLININGNDMEITSEREPKFVRFNITADIIKGKEKIKFAIKNRDDVFIKDRKLVLDKAILAVNNSKVFIDAFADQQNNFDLKVYSNNFDVKNVVELLNTNLVIPNGAEMLAFFKDIKGNFDFKINMTNKGINGDVKLKQSSLKIIPVNNLPVYVSSGNIKISNTQIKLNDFKGWYGSSQKNRVQLAGTIDDYTKSVDTNIEISGVATNDLTKNYISPLVGCPLTLTGDSGTKMIVKSKYNKIDLSVMGKIAKGYDILVDGASLSPVNYDRAYVADMHLDGNLLNIKSIRYFIAKEINKETRNIKPILTIDGNMDIVTQELKDIGFNIPKPLPSEFLNVLIGQKVFKKGTIAGNMHVIFRNNIPKMKGTLEMNQVRVPSQRLSVKAAKLTTDKDLIKINANGRFKRSDYDFKGYIKNELIFPVVIKDINLTVDNIDIDRILTSMNQQNTQEVKQNSQSIETLVSAESNSESDDSYTFDTGLLIVERCILHIVKGFYKDINFGNLYANLTLDKNGLLQIKSNKFDFAEGISTLKILCDLKKHDYYIRLGVKDINSDLIASTLLALPKEITGKAMGLIELNTDDSLKMNGRIRFNIQDGTIQKVGLVQYALNFAALFRNPMAMLSPSTIIDLVNVPEGKFKKINGDLVMKDNVVEKIMIKSSAPQLSSFIIGRYDLETKDASLRIYTKFSSKNKGFAGFLRNISLNSLANRMPLSSESEANYYAMELAQLPPLEADEKDCQVFLTKVDGDVEHFNFLSSLKKIK